MQPGIHHRALDKLTGEFRGNPHGQLENILYIQTDSNPSLQSNQGP